MGKVRKDKAVRKHDPLEKQITSDLVVSETKKSNAKKPKQLAENKEYLDSKTSKKILKQAKDLLQEEEDEQREEQPKIDVREMLRKKTSEDSSDEEFSDVEEFNEEEFENIDIDENDEKILQNFMGNNQYENKTLADIILEKIREKEQRDENAKNALNPELEREEFIKKLPYKVVEVYKGVGQVLRRYKSGKLPKAFKIIPSLSNWEEVLYLTDPDNWSNQTVYQATRIFASNLNPKMAQRFYNLVLLPRVRQEIKSTQKLNVHVYNSIRKAVFKPAAFYKGLILPLLESGTCTLKEAFIVGSVIAKVSIPVLHSSAALLKIASMAYSGANSMLIRVILNKKYALPYRVIDSLVMHFYNMRHEQRQLPVLWHQALLVFAERYKGELTKEQKSMLFEACRIQTHPQITPEIRRELTYSTCRGEVVQPTQISSTPVDMEM